MPVSQGTFCHGKKSCNLCISFIFFLCWNFIYTNWSMSLVTLLSILFFFLTESYITQADLELVIFFPGFLSAGITSMCYPAQFSCFVFMAVLLIGFRIKKRTCDYFMTKLHWLYLDILLDFALIQRGTVTSMVTGLGTAGVFRVCAAQEKDTMSAAFWVLLYQANCSWYLTPTPWSTSDKCLLWALCRHWLWRCA